MGHDNHLTGVNDAMATLSCARFNLLYLVGKCSCEKLLKDGSELEVVEDSEASQQRLDVLVLQV